MSTSIRCGHCHLTHESIREVRDCALAHPPAPITAQALPARDPRLATEKQEAFIERLRKERPSAEVPFTPGELTKSEASALIERLMALPRENVAPSAEFVVTSTVPDGTYTVVMGTNGDQDYVTLRLRPATFAKDLPEGSQVAEFLSGPDNDYSYTGFSFIVKGRARVWSRFKAESRVTAALQFLLTGGQVDEAHERFLNLAEAYATGSGNCMRCLRKLTVPTSVSRGLGPVCAALEGVA